MFFFFVSFFAKNNSWHRETVNIEKQITIDNYESQLSMMHSNTGEWDISNLEKLLINACL